MKFQTRAIHAGQAPDPATGAVIVPVYQTSTFEQDAIGVHRGYEYSRTGNPTRKALEEVLASLEGGSHGLAFASGLAATAAVFHLLGTGDHAVVGGDVYGGTYRLLERVFRQWGLAADYVETTDPDSFRNVIRRETKLIWVESPTNPLLKIADIPAIAALAHEHGVLLAVDNTFASPYFQNPLSFGADIVVHSTTKYLAGHSDTVGGAIVVNGRELHEKLKFHQNAEGAIPGPWDCWLVLRGIKTLALRMREHERNARAIAEFLETHTAVEKVYYPGLKSHSQYELARNQMSGSGGMIGVALKGGFPAVERFISKLRLFILAESLGGVESLVSHPARMTHSAFSEEERLVLGITDGLVRLSVGIEDGGDLLDDVEQALAD